MPSPMPGSTEALLRPSGSARQGRGDHHPEPAGPDLDGGRVVHDHVRDVPDGVVGLVVEGRVKDMVNRGGEKVSAEEVEAHLGEHPAVADSAVIGLPDELQGERACAVVLLKEGFGARSQQLRDELPEFLRDRGLAASEVPQRVEFVQSLPRTAGGTVSRSELVRWFTTC